MGNYEVVRPGFIWQYPAVVDAVTDGDTLVCHVLFKPDEEEDGVSVRLDGINAIEASKRFGGEARDALARHARIGQQVTLLSRKREKYGRLLARVIDAEGDDICAAMLLELASDGVTPLAVPYNP